MEQWKNRDFTLIIDKSGSMSYDSGHGNSRWQAAEEATFGLANKLNELDPDGITLYTFNAKFRRFDNTTPDKVASIFKTEEPGGSTALHLVLEDAFNNYFTRRANGKAQPNGESFFIITDGIPDEESLVAKAIVNASKKLNTNSEMSLTFVQVGSDSHAADYLKQLDDDLEKEGAKYDIVDTITMDDMNGKNLTDVVMAAVTEHKQSK